MGFFAGTSHSVCDHSDMIIMLMGIHSGIVNAHICQTTNQVKRIYLESSQQNFQIRTKKCAVSPF